MGIVLISVGIFVFFLVLFFTLKVTGGPWSFGYSKELALIWIFYILIQVVVPVYLVYLGIGLL